MARSAGEMPFLDHLEELRSRILKSLGALKRLTFVRRVRARRSQKTLRPQNPNTSTNEFTAQCPSVVHELVVHCESPAHAEPPGSRATQTPGPPLKSQVLAVSQLACTSLPQGCPAGTMASHVAASSHAADAQLIAIDELAQLAPAPPSA